MFEPVREMDIYGIFLPPLLLWAFVSVLLVRVCHGVLARKGFYRSDLQQQLFDGSLCVIFAGLLSFCIH